MTIRQPTTLVSAPAGKKTAPVDLCELSGAQQARLNALMARNNNGALTGAEEQELRALVSQAEAVALANARALAHRLQPD
jgi:hypothetical protein